ncbi:MAG: hypothetical protein GC180_11540 [Bacteroidetes bacterium]|nr:hypothetical protein [Bacteroidota bacterium]
MRLWILFLFQLCFIEIIEGQTIHLTLSDPCFSSVGTGPNLQSGDVITQNGDILQWEDGAWTGAHRKSNVNKVPVMPDFCDKPVKAAWLGSGIAWNLNGEGVAFRLSQALEYGKTYRIHFLYASHGAGEDGSFSPFVASSIDGKDFGYPIGQLRPADTAWHYDSIDFVAGFKQIGDEWIILHTRQTESSGIIQALCPQRKFHITPDKAFCFNSIVTLSSSFPLTGYQWSDGSDTSRIKVSSDGVIWLESNSVCGRYRDTLNVKFEACKPGAKGRGRGGGKGGMNGPGGFGISFSFSSCWFGKCDDNDVPNGPPSPPIKVYNVLSMNGDGINETFIVDNAENGRWKLRVFNRYGQLVFEDLEYKNTWIPYQLPASVYYVVLKDRNSDYKYTGTLTIIR